MSLADATQNTHMSASPSNNRTSQVLVLLTPSERAELELVADTEQRSLSATARIMIKRGITQFNDDSLIAD